MLTLKITQQFGKAAAKAGMSGTPMMNPRFMKLLDETFCKEEDITERIYHLTAYGQAWVKERQSSLGY